MTTSNTDLAHTEIVNGGASEDVVMHDDSTNTGPRPTSADGEKEGLGIEDLSLPRTLIQRLAKGALPPQTQLQKDALLSISKATTVFINMLASDAAALAAFNGKKTVQPQDVLAAVDRLEFPAFAPRMQAELEAYQKVKSGKRSVYREKVREREQAQHGGPEKLDGESHNDDDTETGVPTAADPEENDGKKKNSLNGDRREGRTSDDTDGEPAAKKRRHGANGSASAVNGDDDEMVDAEGDDDDGEVEEDDDIEDDEDEDMEEDGLDDEEDEEAAMHRVDDVGGDRSSKNKSTTAMSGSRTGLRYGARDADTAGDDEDEDDD